MSLIRKSVGFIISAALTLCLPDEAGTQFVPPLWPPIPGPEKTFAPASIAALPDLRCSLYSAGRNPAKGLPIFTDEDGYARFHAVKVARNDAARLMVLDCSDSAGKSFTYSIDLSADETFSNRPRNPANDRGTERAALIGDPLSYSQAELIKSGYGFRPEPTDTAAYARWLSAASLPARLLQGKPATGKSHFILNWVAPNWAGSALAGIANSLSSDSAATGNYYLASVASFVVPRAVAGKDTAGVSLWNGVGGWSGSGLIQTGIDVRSSPTAATYFSFREYCCGDPSSNGYAGNFTPNPGDEIFSMAWYCDSNGLLNIAGGYGCTFLQNKTSGEILNCTSPTGSPCWSVPALPLCSISPMSANCMRLGGTAECVLELEEGVAWPLFASRIEMDCLAFASTTNRFSQNISNDPLVWLLADFTNNSITKLRVTLGTYDQTYFDIFHPPADCAALVQIIENLASIGIPGPHFRPEQWTQIQRELEDCVRRHQITQQQKDAVINQYNDYIAAHNMPPRPDPCGLPGGGC